MKLLLSIDDDFDGSSEEMTRYLYKNIPESTICNQIVTFMNLFIARKRGTIKRIYLTYRKHASNEKQLVFRLLFNSEDGATAYFSPTIDYLNGSNSEVLVWLQEQLPQLAQEGPQYNFNQLSHLAIEEVLSEFNATNISISKENITLDVGKSQVQEVSILDSLERFRK